MYRKALFGMERLLVGSVLMVASVILVEGEVFTREQQFAGLSVSPDGQDVFVVAGGSLIRLDQNLREVGNETFPGSLIAFTVDSDPSKNRSYLCWLGNTQAECQVRDRHGKSNLYASRNMRVDTNSLATDYFMFRGLATAAKSTITQIISFGGGFIVAQPIDRPTPTIPGSAMAMVRFNSAAEVVAYLPVATRRSNVDLSAELETISSFQAILTSEASIYFVYTLDPDTIYNRPISYIARVCANDTLSGIPVFGTSYVNNSYLTYLDYPLAYRAFSTKSVVTAVTFAEVSDSSQTLGFLITAFGGGFQGENSVLYGMNKTVLNQRLNDVYSSCQNPGGAIAQGAVRLSPFTNGKNPDCTTLEAKSKLTDRRSPIKTYICGSGNQIGHWPISFQPEKSELIIIPDPGDKIYDTRSTSFNIVSLKSVVVDNTSLLIASTSEGSVMMFELTVSLGTLTAKLYSRQKIDTSSRSLNSIVVSPDKTSLYMMANKTTASKSAVYKQLLTDCSKFSTCQECLGVSSGADIQYPICGWCLTAAACTRMTECPLQPATWERTLTSCPAVKSLAPVEVPVQIATSITLTMIGTVPNGSYSCGFDSAFTTTKTPAVREQHSGSITITCSTPEKDSLSTASITSDVSIYYSLGGKDVILLSSKQTQNLTIYDCTQNVRCEECKSTQFTCGWCNYDSECAVTQSRCTKYKSSQGDWSNKSAIVCPTATLTGQSSPISTRTDVTQDFTVMNAVPQSGQGVQYQCGYKSGAHTEMVSATISSGSNTVTVTCNPKKLPKEFGGSTGIQNGTVFVLFGTYELSPVGVTYYDCATLGRDCTACLARKNIYPLCSYCSDMQECQTSGDSCSTSHRHFSLDNCPLPTLNAVKPVNGPVDGGTMLRVLGKNLGTSENDIDNIQLNSSANAYPCNAIRDFEFGVGVSCTTTKAEGQANKVMSLTATIKTTQQNRYTVSLPNAFTYVQPTVDSFLPKHGPVDGGTIVTFSGTNLDSSNASLKVKIGSSTCDVLVLTGITATCKTRNMPVGNSFSVVVQIDDFSKTVGKFSYKPNPTIASSQPISIASAIKSGGTQFIVRGSGFNAASRFTAIFTNSIGTKGNSSCTLLNDTALSCNVVGGAVSTIATIDIQMDGFLLSSIGNISYVTDPTITEYTPSSIRLDEVSTIKVVGSGLDAAGLSKNDYRIKIGQQDCEVQSIDSEQIFCSIKPSGKSGKVPFIVSVGSFTQKLNDMSLTESDSLNIIIIILPVVGAIILLVIIIILVVVRYKRKAAQQSMEMKRLLVQMDNIEANVARECKEAFTELQTNLGAIASTEDSSDVDIPFLDFDQYALHMLFPQGQSEQSILRPLDQKLALPPDDLHRLNEVLDKFEARLLLDRRFLIPFIHTLESQGSKFGMRDRVMVASLLMVGLQDNLYYSTEVLKLLLGDLIKKTVSKNPKLLLRRTESVAEKLLTNWLTFCLHDYIRAVAGRPLFTLFRAIKTHLENGPVDAMTGEAKNSLSEEKLLREKVEHKEISCMAVWEKSQQYTVRLLDCDTISQAKEKVLDAMYKTMPVSQRPGFHAVDLGLVSPSGDAAVPLRDEDQSSEVSGDMKRINTIGRYHVSNGAMFKLLDRASQPGGDRVRDYTAMLIARPGLASQMSQEEDGLRRWHLTRQSEVASDERSRQGKLVSEVYLTRLLTAKKVLQKFVDDLFESIFKSGHSGQVPAAIKYLFDYIDQQAVENGITDAEAIQTWKNNSVPLRFWINVIKNPEFVFDIHKSTTIDACLSIIAQAFMDSCATSELRLTKDSPSTKLLYAREVEEYRPRVRNYYSEVHSMTPINESEMATMMGHASKAHPNSGLNKRAALFELFQYTSRFSEEISDSLSETNMTGLVRLLEELQDSCPVVTSHSRRV